MIMRRFELEVLMTTAQDEAFFKLLDEDLAGAVHVNTCMNPLPKTGNPILVIYAFYPDAPEPVSLQELADGGGG